MFLFFKLVTTLDHFLVLPAHQIDPQVFNKYFAPCWTYHVSFYQPLLSKPCCSSGCISAWSPGHELGSLLITFSSSLYKREALLWQIDALKYSEQKCKGLALENTRKLAHVAHGWLHVLRGQWTSSWKQMPGPMQSLLGFVLLLITYQQHRITRYDFLTIL